MPDFSLVPVDHEPDFSDVSLVPVDHDPFGMDGAVWQSQQAQMQTQPAQCQPQSPPQQPGVGADQPNVGSPAAGDGPSFSSDQGKPEPPPFGGFANPTPTESLVNRFKMKDEQDAIEANPQAGRIIDGGDLYRFVITGLPLAHYPIDGNTGSLFTAIYPFYAYDGTRYALIDASRERPVTVRIPEDGRFTINRP